MDLATPAVCICLYLSVLGAASLRAWRQSRAQFIAGTAGRDETRARQIEFFRTKMSEFIYDFNDVIPTILFELTVVGAIFLVSVVWIIALS